jgi:hypothetical protein
VRADVWERFEAAAKELLEVEGTYVACVAAEVADDQQVWSMPVQYRFVKRDQAGLLDIEMRSLSLVGIEPV